MLDSRSNRRGVSAVIINHGCLVVPFTCVQPLSSDHAATFSRGFGAGGHLRMCLPGAGGRGKHTQSSWEAEEQQEGEAVQ